MANGGGGGGQGPPTTPSARGRAAPILGRRGEKPSSRKPDRARAGCSTARGPGTFMSTASTSDADVTRSPPTIEKRRSNNGWGSAPGPEQRSAARRRYALLARAPARFAPRATPARTLRSLLGSHLNSGAAEAEKVVVAVA